MFAEETLVLSKDQANFLSIKQEKFSDYRIKTAQHGNCYAAPALGAAG
ncbi:MULTISPECIES: hypothetical protein [unclassified Undibacterium]|nr:MULTISPECIES: hypothetical protein [unclassified Undibacterium]MEB0173499.1 hypothetical protein [Undibacterium sp. CCC1.1]MEB0177485.1 hypothetical protein [Undibacterium sp. CCC3.4]MEB0216649.1 hypothetical protein [Undibacterium sp. 5I2]